MKLGFLGLLICMAMMFPVMAEPLSPDDLDRISMQRIKEHVLFEMYTDTDKGIASVFGYHWDAYVSENWFYSMAIFGAVGGERGGYGIAAFGGGFNVPITLNLAWDIKGLIGSGGGGGLKAGGGFAVELLTGFSFKFLPSSYLETRIGYLQFPTGSFKTPIVNVGMSFDTQRLHLGY